MNLAQVAPTSSSKLKWLNTGFIQQFILYFLLNFLPNIGRKIRENTDWTQSIFLLGLGAWNKEEQKMVLSLPYLGSNPFNLDTGPEVTQKPPFSPYSIGTPKSLYEWWRGPYTVGSDKF